MWIDSQPINYVHEYGPTLISATVYLVSGILLLRTAGKRAGKDEASLADVMRWKDDHERESKQRDDQLSALREIAASSTATAKAQAEQLKLIQQELRDHRIALQGKHHDLGF